MRILITNVFFDVRGGTQLYVAELAEELLRRGHHPIVYSTILGPLADELVARTVPVVSDLASIGEAPDLIHGHHTLETIAALVRFPSAPALYVTHDWSYVGDSAPKHPRIYRYLAVDDTLRDRLVAREGIPDQLVSRTRNWVDTRRYQARSIPLPTRPARALVFSNLASDQNFLPTIRTACEQHGIQLDVVGTASNRVIANPETLLGEYDLVFAKARAAIEAMGSGCAVVLCDLVGFGGMVTTDRFDALREVNFGRRCLSATITPEAVSNAILAYDAQDARSVCELVRAGSSQVQVVDELIEEYRAVIDAHRAASASASASAVAAADRDGAASAAVFGPLTKRVRMMEFESVRLNSEVQNLHTQAATQSALTSDLLESVERLEAAESELERARHELDQIKSSSTFVARDRLFARPSASRALLPIVRRIAGRRST